MKILAALAKLLEPSGWMGRLVRQAGANDNQLRLEANSLGHFNSPGEWS
jgi:hypothetical protein